MNFTYLKSHDRTYEHLCKILLPSIGTTPMWNPIHKKSSNVKSYDLHYKSDLCEILRSFLYEVDLREIQRSFLLVHPTRNPTYALPELTLHKIICLFLHELSVPKIVHSFLSLLRINWPSPIKNDWLIDLRLRNTKKNRFGSIIFFVEGPYFVVELALYKIDQTPWEDLL